MCQLLGIAVEVEEWGDTVGLAQRRIDVDVAISAPRGEVLALQSAEGDDLDDGLGVGPLLNGQLVASGLTKGDSKDNDMALTLATDKKFILLAGLLHRAQRFMRFNCVLDALGEFVPDLQRLVLA